MNEKVEIDRNWTFIGYDKIDFKIVYETTEIENTHVYIYVAFVTIIYIICRNLLSTVFFLHFNDKEYIVSALTP